MGTLTCVVFIVLLFCPDFTVATSSHSVVVAIDVGTMYSSYAFSLPNAPLNVVYAAWGNGLPKIPTVVLLEPSNKFDSFGSEAEEKYFDLAAHNEHHGWRLFRRFKMVLHTNTAFLNAQGTATALNQQDVKYVLTVPAIWTESAKQFMREAANEAGMSNNILKIALESEVASIACQDVVAKANTAFQISGAQFIAIDIGGGLAEMSVHEIQQDNTLKELRKASGGPWGGNDVNKNYLQWLTNLFGEDTMKRFKEEKMAENLELQRYFEIKKRSITADTNSKIVLHGLMSLKKIYDETENTPFDDKVAALGLSGKITYNSSNEEFEVGASVIKEWFASPVNNITSHVKALIEEQSMQRVTSIIVVGGFDKNKLVIYEMQKEIRNRSITIPKDGDLFVLKGAVKFGHFPDIISSRIMTFTYGLRVMEEYDQNIHQLKQPILIYNKLMVDDVFLVLLRVDDEVVAGKEITNIIKINTEAKSLYMYKSTDRAPKCVTGEGCTLLGQIIFDLQAGSTPVTRQLDFILMVDTELHVTARDLVTGIEVPVSITTE